MKKAEQVTIRKDRFLMTTINRFYTNCLAYLVDNKSLFCWQRLEFRMTVGFLRQQRDMIERGWGV